MQSPALPPYTYIFRRSAMYSAFKEFYNLLSQVDSAYHDAALKLGLTDSELDILYSLNEHGSGCNQSIFYFNIIAMHFKMMIFCSILIHSK